jgi:hypothetical protein
MKCIASLLVAALASATAFGLSGFQGGLRGSKPSPVGVPPVQGEAIFRRYDKIGTLWLLIVDETTCLISFR